MNDGKTEIELELDQDSIDYLNKLAKSKQITFDEAVEHVLRLEIDRIERNGTIAE